MSPRPDAAAVPRLLAIASGKGGVGKTWLASTLAHAFAHAGERVLLIDGDLGLANVDVQLGVTPAHDLGAVLTGRLSPAEAVTPFAGGAGTRGGFDILAGKSGSGALAALGPAELAQMTAGLTLLCPHYDRTLIDLGAGLEPPVLALTALAGTTLVVLTDEPTSLTDAYALIKVMRLKSGARDVRIAVNMALHAAAGRRTWEALAQACRSFLGFEPPLAGVIRRDERVREAIRRQTAFLTRSPAAPAAEDVIALAKALAARPEVPEHEAGPLARLR